MLDILVCLWYNIPMFSHTQLCTAKNTPRTTSLFYELSSKDASLWLFTTKNEDHTLNDGRVLLSFRKLYLELTEEDPTEYNFAVSVFHTWDHWERVCDTAKLKPMIEQLRKENMIRQKAKSMKWMIGEVSKDGKSAMSASKFLAGAGWMDKETKKVVDVPEVDRKANSEVSRDAERIGLTVVK